MALRCFCCVKCLLEPTILCASLDSFECNSFTCAVFSASAFSTNCAETKTNSSFAHLALFDLDAHRNLFECLFIKVKSVNSNRNNNVFTFKVCSNSFF